MKTKNIAGIMATILISFAGNVVHADTCKQENEHYPFRQVILGDGAGRCDYGKEFDFSHSYQFQGNFKPAAGPWQGASEPDLVYCQSAASSDCVFVEEK